MLNKLRNWLIIKLVGKKPIMMNMDVTASRIVVNQTIEADLFTGNAFGTIEKDPVLAIRLPRGSNKS